MFQDSVAGTLPRNCVNEDSSRKYGLVWVADTLPALMSIVLVESRINKQEKFIKNCKTEVCAYFRLCLFVTHDQFYPSTKREALL